MPAETRHAGQVRSPGGAAPGFRFRCRFDIDPQFNNTKMVFSRSPPSAPAQGPSRFMHHVRENARRLQLHTFPSRNCCPNVGKPPSSPKSPQVSSRTETAATGRANSMLKTLANHPPNKRGASVARLFSAHRKWTLIALALPGPRPAAPHADLELLAASSARFCNSSCSCFC